MAGGWADGTEVVIKTQGHARQSHAEVVHRLVSLGGRGEQWPSLTRQSPSPHSVNDLCRIWDIHSHVEADTYVSSG